MDYEYEPPSMVSATWLKVTATVGVVGAGPLLVTVVVYVVVSVEVESWPEAVVVEVTVVAAP